MLQVTYLGRGLKLHPLYSHPKSLKRGCTTSDHDGLQVTFVAGSRDSYVQNKAVLWTKCLPSLLYLVSAKYVAIQMGLRLTGKDMETPADLGPDTLMPFFDICTFHSMVASFWSQSHRWGPWSFLCHNSCFFALLPGGSSALLRKGHHWAPLQPIMNP